MVYHTILLLHKKSELRELSLRYWTVQFYILNNFLAT